MSSSNPRCWRSNTALTNLTMLHLDFRDPTSNRAARKSSQRPYHLFYGSSISFDASQAVGAIRSTSSYPLRTVWPAATHSQLWLDGPQNNMELTAMFDLMRCGVSLFGTTLTPNWTAQLSTIWEFSTPCLSAIDLIVGSLCKVIADCPVLNLRDPNNSNEEICSHLEANMRWCECCLRRKNFSAHTEEGRAVIQLDWLLARRKRLWAKPLVSWQRNWIRRSPWLCPCL